MLSYSFTHFLIHSFTLCYPRIALTLIRGYLHLTHFNKFNASPYGVIQRNFVFFLIFL